MPPAAFFRYRCALGLFIFGLILSGVTAFPLLTELNLLVRLLGLEKSSDISGVAHWVLTVREGLAQTYASYPWLAYGTDWQSPDALCWPDRLFTRSSAGTDRRTHSRHSFALALD